MKKHIASIFIGLIFLTGLSLLLYPTVSEYVNSKHQSRAVAAYGKAVEAIPEEDYNRDLEAGVSYYECLTRYHSLGEAVAMEQKRENDPYQSLLRVSGTDTMGVIRIPVIGVNLPIYHGTDEAVLQVGVGHYEGSSLPIGGESTHSILTGHRGLPSAKLFTDLDRLEVDDVFYIQTLGEILEYQIDQIQVVLPEETDSLAIESGQDYVTLITCTPYGVNSHRMLLRGTRIPYDGKDQEKQPKKTASRAEAAGSSENQGRSPDTRQWILIAFAAFAAAILLGLLVPTGSGKKKQAKETNASQTETEEKEGCHEDNDEMEAGRIPVGGAAGSSAAESAGAGSSRGRD